MRFRCLALAPLFLAVACTAQIGQSSFFPSTALAPDVMLAPPPGYQLTDAMLDLPGLGQVHAVRLDNPESDVTLIYAGGNMSFVAGQTATAAALASATEADIIFYDYPGRGGTNLPNTVDAAIAFGPAFIDALREREWIGSGPTYVYGLSFGGSQAASIARAANPAGLIIEGSAADIAAVGRNFVPGLMKPFVRVRTDADLDRFDYLGYIAEANTPVLLISSRDDRIVKPANIAAFGDQLRARNVPVTIVSVPGQHGRALNEQEAIEALRRFTVNR